MSSNNTVQLRNRTFPYPFVISADTSAPIFVQWLRSECVATSMQEVSTMTIATVSVAYLFYIHRNNDCNDTSDIPFNTYR